MLTTPTMTGVALIFFYRTDISFFVAIHFRNHFLNILCADTYFFVTGGLYGMGTLSELM